MRIAIAAALALLLALPAAASATFPGRDGRLAAVYRVWTEDICGPVDSHTCEHAHDRLLTMGARGHGKRVVDRCEDCLMSRLAWSPTGRRIAWSKGTRLFLSLAAGGLQDSVPGVQGFGPTWRPDNSGLAFSTPAGKVATVAASGVPMNVVDGGEPVWCRDGTIVFAGYDHRLMAVRPDGTGLRRVAREGFVGAPDCSPAGRKVIFRSADRIYVASLRGGAVHRVHAPASATDPVWSPSGRRIAWSDGHDIWIARPDGTRARKATRNRHRGQYLFPSWQPLR
jgi:hypothetical protein